MDAAFRIGKESIASTLGRSLVFGGWPEEAIEHVCSDATLVSLMPGDIVIYQGQMLDSLYAILSGQVSIACLSSQGQRYIRRLAGACSVFGFVSILDRLGSPHCYTAHTRSRVLMIRRETFLQALDRWPRLWMRVALAMAANHRNALNSIEQVLFEPAGRRLAQALGELAEQEADTSRWWVNLTQDELAGLIGVSRQSISASLREFQRRGLIRIEYRKVELLQRSCLLQAT